MSTVNIITDAAGPKGPRSVDVEVTPNSVLAFDAQGAPVSKVVGAADVGATPAAHATDPAAHGNGINKLTLLAIAAPDVPIVATHGVGSLTGDYKWQISAYTTRGDSCFSDLSEQVTASGNTVRVSLPVHIDPRVVGWHIYRSKIGDTARTFLAGTVPNGTLYFDDNVADGDLGKDSHYLQTVTGYTCEGITINGEEIFNVNGLNVFLGEHAGDTLKLPENQSLDTLYSQAMGSSALSKYIAGGGMMLAIGGGALQNTEHAGQVTAVGHKAGQNSDWITGCAYFGAMAGQSNTRSDNTFLGNAAGQTNTTGESNTVVGSSAATGNFSRSVVLGKGATATSDDQCMIAAANLELALAASGIVLRSADGTRYRITVTNAGALAVAAA